MELTEDRRWGQYCILPTISQRNIYYSIYNKKLLTVANLEIKPIVHTPANACYTTSESESRWHIL
jgi:hypothetical protein